MPGGHPGHVAESPGGQTQHGGVLGGSGRGDAHQRGGREVGYVGHDGHQRVVPIGRQGDDLGAQGRDHGPDPRQGVSVGRRGRGQHPGGVYEHLGVGAVDALLLGAGHRVAAYVAGVSHRVDHRCLHAAHVGHQTGGRDGEGLGHRGGQLTDRGGHEGHLSVGVPADPIQRTHVHRCGQCRLVEIHARDVPTPGP